MALPIVAVVGRPNVGKSTLVNRLAQAPTPSCTRRAASRATAATTARTGTAATSCSSTPAASRPGSIDEFRRRSATQALVAAEEADVIVFLVDGKCGSDARTTRRSRASSSAPGRRSSSPSTRWTPRAERTRLHEFWSLGLGEPWPVSAMHGHGTGDLLDEIVEVLPEREPEAEARRDRHRDHRPAERGQVLAAQPARGRRARHRLARSPGTTRDAIDTVVERDGTRYRLVDTAGLRRAGARSTRTSSTTASCARCARSTAPTWRCSSSTRPSASPTRTSASRASPRSAAARSSCCSTSGTPSRRTRRRSELVERDLATGSASSGYAPVLRISALTGRGVDRICDARRRRVRELHAQITDERAQQAAHRAARVRAHGHQGGQDAARATT